MVKPEILTSFIIGKDIIVNKGELNLYLIKRNSHQLLDRMFLMSLSEQTHVHIPQTVTFTQDNYYYELVAEASDIHGVAILNSNTYQDLTRVIIDKIERTYGRTLERNINLKEKFYQTKNFNELLSILLKIDVAQKQHVKELSKNAYKLVSKEVDEHVHVVAQYGSFKDSLQTQADTDDSLRIELLALKTCVLKIAKYYDYKEDSFQSDVFSNVSDEPLDMYVENILRSNHCLARKIHLTDDFYKSVYTDPVLAFISKKNNTEDINQSMPVLLYLDANGSYYENYHGERCPINKGNAEIFIKDAIVFYSRLQENKGFKAIFQVAFSKTNSSLLSVLAILMICSGILGLIFPLMIKYIVANIVPFGLIEELSQILILVIFLSIGFVGINISLNVIINIFSTSRSEKLQIALFDKILNTSIKDLKSIELGDVSKKIISSDYIKNFIVKFFGICIYSNLAIFSFISMILYDSNVSKIALFVMLIFLVIYSILIAVNLKSLDKYNGNKEILNAKLRQIIEGITRIKVTNTDRYIISRYMSNYTQLVLQEYQLLRYTSFHRILISLIPLSLCLFFLIFNTNTSDSQLPSLCGFLTAFYFFLIGISYACISLWAVLPVRWFYKSIMPIINAQVESGMKTESLDKFLGNIELSHVYFHYPNSDVDVLKNISLKIASGEFVAIVGASGAGKSSLVDLLIGFFAPSRGAIYYDDFELKVLNKTSVRNHIGVVLQKSQIEETSILDNIVKGTNFGLDEAERVSDVVGLTEEISKLPMGFHTLVSKRNLSKGQQQKLLIAKALVGTPSLIIMDEATSSLDNYSQKIIMEKISKLNLTRIVVSNRSSVVRAADNIFVMQEGVIVAEGKFKELYENSELFKSLIS